MISECVSNSVLCVYSYSYSYSTTQDWFYPFRKNIFISLRGFISLRHIQSQRIAVARIEWEQSNASKRVIMPAYICIYIYVCMCGTKSTTRTLKKDRQHTTHCSIYLYLYLVQSSCVIRGNTKAWLIGCTILPISSLFFSLIFYPPFLLLYFSSALRYFSMNFARFKRYLFFLLFFVISPRLFFFFMYFTVNAYGNI